MRDREDEPYEELARELRQGAGAEMRTEAEITELETLQGRLRRRALSDVALEALHRGDRLSVHAPDRTLIGEASYVGSDYLTLEAATKTVDLRLDRIAISASRRTSGGLSSSGGSRTFRARLAEYEQTGEPVTVVCSALGLERRGRLAVVASDHVVVESEGDETVVPLGLIDLVFRPRPGSAR